MGGQTCNDGGVDAAAEVYTNGDISSKANANGLDETVTYALNYLLLGSRISYRLTIRIRKGVRTDEKVV